MDLGLRGKVALVCGGSRGMGRAIALRFAEEAADLAVVSRTESDLAKVCSEIKSRYKRKALPIVCDLSRLREIPKVIKAVEKEYGALHILINNAGGPPPGTFLDVSDEDWEQTLNQNLKSAILLTKLAVPLMRKQKFGRVINITSQLIKEPAPDMILSITARTALVAFAKAISHQVAGEQINVHTLCPGNILTERLHSLVEMRAKKSKESVQQVIERMTQSIPVKRIGTPEEFADVAVFLASERASYLTGTAIAVDGGVTKSLL